MATITLPENFAAQAWNEPFTLTVQFTSRGVYDLFLKAIANQTFKSSRQELLGRVGFGFSMLGLVMITVAMWKAEQWKQSRADKIVAAGMGVVTLGTILSYFTNN